MKCSASHIDKAKIYLGKSRTARWTDGHTNIEVIVVKIVERPFQILNLSHEIMFANLYNLSLNCFYWLWLDRDDDEIVSDNDKSECDAAVAASDHDRVAQWFNLSICPINFYRYDDEGKKIDNLSSLW